MKVEGTLSRQLLALVIGSTLVLSVPVSIFNTWRSYRQEATRQQEQVDAVMSLFGVQLRQAVWDFDQHTVQSVLAGLTHFPALQSVDVVAPDMQASYRKAGTSAARAGPLQIYPLRAPEGDMLLGELRLRVDTAALSRQIWAGVGRSLATLALELSLLAVLMFALLKRRVTIPVLSLSRHVREMTGERLDEPAPQPAGRTPNELHELARGVTRLQRELKEQLAQRDRIARTLQDSEAHLKLMADSIPNQLWTCRPDGRFDYVSQRALDYFGLSFEQMVGLSWEAIVHPDDLPDCLARWSKSLETGAAYRTDLRLRRSDGSYAWHAIMGVAQRDAGGAVVKWFGSSTDITDRKRGQEELLQSQKMNAIGHLAGGIAHDFNNQLAAILGFAELLDAQLDNPKLKPLTSGIIVGAGRCRDLTKNLLAFSRKQQLQSVPTDVHQLIDETVVLLERSIDKRITIVQELDAQRCIVRGDPTQMQNALLNLALNARDAMPAGGRLSFVTQLVELPERAPTPRSELLTQLGLPAGAYLSITVSDTGTGMSEQVKQHLFEPFFTTKPVGHGTGMGLASVYGTVKSHNGIITVETELGRGTSFHLYLPLSAPDADEGARALSDRPAPTGLSVLVVDDERLVRDLLGVVLGEGGNTVLLAENGEQALGTYAQRWREIDLVILDMMMPGLGGLDTFKALKRINPDVKVLVSSGFGAQGEIEVVLQQGAQGFLQKPFEQQQLAAAIARVMRQRAVG